VCDLKTGDACWVYDSAGAWGGIVKCRVMGFREFASQPGVVRVNLVAYGDDKFPLARDFFVDSPAICRTLGDAKARAAKLCAEAIGELRGRLNKLAAHAARMQEVTE